MTDDAYCRIKQKIGSAYPANPIFLKILRQMHCLRELELENRDSQVR